MGKLILIAATLLLVVITTQINGALPYKFGDMIAFPRKTPFTFKHYGIYLDKKIHDKQKNDENLFHLTGPVIPGISNCVFGKLEEQGDHELDNYLDKTSILNGKEISEADITERIKEKYLNCIWEGRSNNCEHIATYVRYGVKISLQCGQSAANLVTNRKKNISPTLLEQIKRELEAKKDDLRDPDCQVCQLKPGPSHG